MMFAGAWSEHLANCLQVSVKDLVKPWCGTLLVHPGSTLHNSLLPWAIVAGWGGVDLESL